MRAGLSTNDDQRIIYFTICTESTLRNPYEPFETMAGSLLGAMLKSVAWGSYPRPQAARLTIRLVIGCELPVHGSPVDEGDR